MNKLWHLRPSPALVVASVALLVALAGTGYAAISLPANSVGTAQLKNGAVTGAKVHLRSLLGSDFKLGQLPRGSRGPAGQPGPPGAPGSAGPAGPAGASAAYSKSVVGPVALTTATTTIASLAIPQAGNYVVTGKAYATTTGNAEITCQLVAGTDLDQSKIHAFGISQTTTTTVTHQYTAAGTADFKCSSTSTSGTLNYIRVVAIQVGSLTNS
jgi:hypothetical protein